MRNSLRHLHVPRFSCKLFYISVLLLCFLATVTVNKDEYITNVERDPIQQKTLENVATVKHCNLKASRRLASRSAL